MFAGDLLDLPDWSDKFVSSPEFYWSTQPAVVEMAWWLAQFRAAVPAARIVVLEGNHDARLEKALIVHLNQVYQLRPTISTPACLQAVHGTAPIHDDRLLSAALVAVYDDLARDGTLPLGRAASALIPPADPLSRLRF